MNFYKLQEYTQFLNAGYKDVSSPKQVKAGTIWFANDDINWECGVYANGYIRFINLNNPSAYNNMTGVLELRMVVKGQPLVNDEDYRNSLNTLFTFLKNYSGAKTPADRYLKKEIEARKERIRK